MRSSSLPGHLAWAAASALLFALPTIAAAEWQPGGVSVFSTAAALRPVVACPDGSAGSFVAWQPAGGGELRAQHLLATGVLDSAWPATGALLGDQVIDRTALAIVPDRLGGLYALWREGDALYLSRLAPGGGVAPGWPARGRLLGTMAHEDATAALLEDGAHGVYVSWVEDLLVGTDRYVVRVARLSPSGAAAAGWPTSAVRTLSPEHVVLTLELGTQLAPDAAGGVFVGWTRWSADTLKVPGAFVLARLGPTGTAVPGWPANGLEFRAGVLDHTAFINYPVACRLLGVAADGRGGVFAISLDPRGPLGPGPSSPLARLDRIAADGSPAAGFPPGGVFLPWASLFRNLEVDGSWRVIADGRDGVVASGQIPVTDSPPIEGYQGYDASGSPVTGRNAELIARSHETAADGGGGVYAATSWPDGPFGPFSPPALLTVGRLHDAEHSTLFFESHDAPGAWYGDIALTATDDGGAVFFWSQVNERFGLFARRFSPAGEVTGAPAPGPVGLRCTLRHVRGVGVLARLGRPAPGPARLELYDVTGRRLAATELPVTAGSREILLPHTRDLAPGIVFAKLTSAAATTSARVAITR